MSTFLIVQCCTKKTEIIFDVADLLHNNIDSIRIKLDNCNMLSKTEFPSVDKFQDSLKRPDGYHGETYDVYEKKGYTLYIKYNVNSRKVQSFVVISKKRRFSKLEGILNIINLKLNDPFYRIETDTTWSWGGYSNVTVYPNDSIK